MPTSCFYFDGFCKSELEKRPNALSAWLKTTSELSELVINRRIDKSDSLKTRWCRAKKLIDRFCDRQVTTIRILGYSMGCHLAVRFADELIATAGVRDFCLWLIAPDPKFRHNELDESELPSAYQEAHEFWDADCPSERPCSTLNHLTKSVENQIQVIYSKGRHRGLVGRKRGTDGKKMWRRQVPVVQG